MSTMTPSRPHLGIHSLEEGQAFIDQITALRAISPKADEFFRQFLEFCQDFERQHQADLDVNNQMWLFRLGRMLAIIGEDILELPPGLSGPAGPAEEGHHGYAH